MQNQRPKPVVLCILDGWGEHPLTPDNGIEQAHIPNWHRFKKDYPHTALEASGLAVGLPEGQMGNSEVGHLTLGAGRILYQDLPRIDHAMVTGDLEKIPTFQKFLSEMRQSGGHVHLMGLLSPGGVHSHTTHLKAYVELLHKAEIPVWIHAWLDGRDTPPQSALDYVTEFEAFLKDYPQARIATLMGRYYAMDRDQRWERTEQAYKALYSAFGTAFENPIEAVKEAYKEGETDEFILPRVWSHYPGIKPTDGLLMANFRSDRMRQIAAALLKKEFAHFPTQPFSGPRVSATQYDETFNNFLPVLFAPEHPKCTLGECLETAGLSQLRTAETEKYAHVTFFFSGGRERPFNGEERRLVPSPKVATYDLQPEMSAAELTQTLVDDIQAERYDVYVVNYANTDMVGHTGNLPAVLKAVQAVDTCLGHLEKAVLDQRGFLLVTADHGNAEMMVDPITGAPHTAHTSNLVPFILVGQDATHYHLRTQGGLADVAPTMLQLLHLPQPSEMTGKSLINDVA